MPQDSPDKPLPLKDWLWRLDQIEETLEQLIPAKDLHVLFTLRLMRPAFSSSVEINYKDTFGHAEMETFPYGHALRESNGANWSYIDPEWGNMYVSLGNRAFPFVFHWGMGDRDGFGIEDAMPTGAYTEENDGIRVYRDDITWCRWEYLKIPQRPKDGKTDALIEEWNRIEESIGVALAFAPKTLLNKIGNIVTLGNWPDTLFYLSLKRCHPLIQSWGTAVHKPPLPHTIVDLCIPARRPRKPRKRPPSKVRFEDANDYVIFLEPDLRTATEYAFAYFRQVAKDEEAKAAQAATDVSPDAARAGEAFRRQLETDPELRCAMDKIAADLKARAKAFQSPEFKEAEKKTQDQWKSNTGEEYPQTLEEWGRSAMLAVADFNEVVKGDWTLAKWEPVIEAGLQRRREPGAATGATSVALEIPEILKGTHEILTALKRPTGESSWRAVKGANKKREGPIHIESNRPPSVDKAKLVAWWTKLHNDYEEMTETTQGDRDRKATARHIGKAREASGLAAEDHGLSTEDTRRTHLAKRQRCEVCGKTIYTGKRCLKCEEKT